MCSPAGIGSTPTSTTTARAGPMSGTEPMTTPTGRESGLFSAMVELADTLVEDFDIIDVTARLVDRCVALLDVDEAGLALSDGRGGLQVMASTSADTHRIETYQLHVGQGPCVEAFHTGAPVSVADLVGAEPRWSRFTGAALDAGFRAVHALPLELRGQVIGAINLFAKSPGQLSSADRRAAQALTRIATVAVLQFRTLHESHRLNQQLQTALTSRIILEQAKGRLLERGRLDTAEEAFTLLRGYARRTNQRLTDVAEAVMNNTVDTGPIVDPRTGRGAGDPAGEPV